jgi:hypothetical protein
MIRISPEMMTTTERRISTVRLFFYLSLSRPIPTRQIRAQRG